MTQPESPGLKAYLDEKFAYLDEKFAGLDEKFAGIDEKFAGLEAGQAGLAVRLDRVENRLDGIDKHLDKQDADQEHRTRSILETIEASAQDSRLWASRLFSVLDQEAAKEKGS
jgi:chromosome segregation ATPase